MAEQTAQVTTEGKQLKSGWQMVKFGDVVRQVKDKVDPRKSGLKYYVAGEHMDTDDLKIRRWGEIGLDYLGPAFHMRFKPGQVLYGSRRTYLRKVAVPDFEGVCADTTFVLESKDPNILLPELLPFIMQTEQFHEHSIKQLKGSVNPYVNFSDLAWFEFALPPLEEQKRFVKVLSAIRNTTLSLQEAREMSFRLWRSLSQKEFGKSPNHCKHKELLSNHYSIVSGQIDPTEPKYAELPLFAPNYIERETGELIELVSAREQGAMSGKYLVEKGNVIYSKIRPELMKATIAPCDGLCSADMYALKPKSTIESQYLLEILLSSEFTQFAISGSKRTGIPKLNRKQLSQYFCNIPDLEEQKLYLNKVSPIHKSRKRFLDRTTQSKFLKKKLLNELSK
jgi:type I restriction enzyme S subunit